MVKILCVANLSWMKGVNRPRRNLPLPWYIILPNLTALHQNPFRVEKKLASPGSVSWVGRCGQLLKNRSVLNLKPVHQTVWVYLGFNIRLHARVARSQFCLLWTQKIASIVQLFELSSSDRQTVSIVVIIVLVIVTYACADILSVCVAPKHGVDANTIVNLTDCTVVQGTLQIINRYLMHSEFLRRITNVGWKISTFVQCSWVQHLYPMLCVLILCNTDIHCPRILFPVGLWVWISEICDVTICSLSLSRCVLMCDGSCMLVLFWFKCYFYY